MSSSQPLEKFVTSDEPPRDNGDRARNEALDLRLAERARRLEIQKWIVPSVGGLVLLWLIFVGFIVVSDGMDYLDYHPSVLVTLLGSATASIVGLLMKVVSYTLPKTN